MTDMEIRAFYNVSAEEYYEAMEGFEQWYSEVNKEVEPFE